MSTEQFNPRYSLGNEGEPHKKERDKGNPFDDRAAADSHQDVDVFHVPRHGSRIGEGTDEGPDFTKDLPAAPEERSTYIPAQREPEAEIQEKKKHTPLWVKVGSFAAGLAVAGGALFGIARNGDNDKAGSAPTNPVPTLENPPVASGAPSSTETASSNEQLSPANYEFTVNGNTYKGQSELVAAMGVDAEKYPTYQEAVPVLIDRINTWLNTGGEAKDLAQAENYKNGNGIHPGIAGVEEDIQDIAWLNALTDGSAASTEFIKELQHDHINNVSYQIQSRKAGDAVPYERKIVIDPTTKGLVGRNVGSIDPEPYEGTVFAYYHVEDNATPNTTMGKLRKASPDGYDGIMDTPIRSKQKVLYITLGTKLIETPDHKTKDIVVITDIKSREVTG